MRQPHPTIKNTPRSRPIGLWILYGFTVASIAGFALFGVHPERLASLSPAAIRIYSVSFRLFALGQVFLAGLVMAAFLTRYVRWKWVTAFVVVYAISLTSELIGTGYGIPFGAYSYSAVLRPMWLDRVPVGIPLSWFYMALPSYAIAMSLFPGRRNVVRKIALSSFILLAWDLALDPAMSSAIKYWEWGEKGPYYGMPLLNLIGWYVTGVALMGALAFLEADSWLAGVSLRWLAGFYGANLLLAIGITAAAGLWLAPIASIGALVLSLAIARLGSARSFSTALPRIARSPG